MVPDVLRPGLVVLLLAVFLCGSAWGAPPDPVRGIILSTHTDGDDWASPGVRSTMDDLRAVGANWVAIHPYAGISTDGTVRRHHFDPERPPDYLKVPIQAAHDAGLQIFITPHLAYWGTPFSWRGAIAFRTEEEWARFFQTYEEWILQLIDSCPQADAFSLGSELDSTLVREKEWRHVIAQARRHTKAPLTYAANWTHYRQVPFWDALDVIGIQAYFPLAEAPDAGAPRLAAAWDSLMIDLRAFAETHNRRIVFTELGYNRSFMAPVRPWDYRVDGVEAEHVQALCLDMALRAVAGEDEVIGAFLWKWFPNPYPVGRNFQLATPLLKEVIARNWAQ